MSKHSKHLVVQATAILCTLITSFPALAEKQAPSGWIEDDPKPTSQPKVGSNGKPMLQGGVEHAQAMPKLPRKLSVGSQFDENMLKGTVGPDNWYRVPPWIVGDWYRDEETVTSSYNYKTGQHYAGQRKVAAVERAQFGVQVDRKGYIWHCRLGQGGVADCGGYYTVAIVQSQEPLVVSRDKVVLRDVFTQLQVNKGTNLITDSTQAESLTTYEPIVDGTLRLSTSVKVFDESGAPTKEEDSFSVTKMSKPFAPLNQYKGIDLVQAFKQFLISNGKQELVP